MATVERQVEGLSLEITRIRRNVIKQIENLFPGEEQGSEVNANGGIKKQYAVDVQLWLIPIVWRSANDTKS
jgi:hypothetical protein